MRHKLNPRKNPFFEYGQVKLYAVHNHKHEMVGRVAAVLNPVHCKAHNESAGFFGLFECINNADAAKVLFDAAREYLRRCKCTHIIGPVNFNTNEDSGQLIEGFDESPMIMCNYSPPYYKKLMEARGFEKAIDLLSYGAGVDHPFPSRYMKVLNRVSLNPRITVRHFDRRMASKEIALIREIYNFSFRDVWGFVPLSHSEADEMGRNFLTFADEELFWFVNYKNNPAGFIMAVPNINEILRDLDGRLFPLGLFKLLLMRRSIRNIRVMVLCMLPEYRSMGIETLLVQKIRERMKAGGYQKAEFSVVNENNTKMRNILESLGFPLVKRYRIYKALL
jgi:ribosomal protein S18 acetylase RimI-like enzyme